MTASMFEHGQMGGSPATLRFVVPGRVVSNNRNIRTMKGRATKSEAARDYQTKVATYASIAARQQGWKWQASVKVTVIHWNGRLDSDNVPKTILDAMRDIAYPDDRRRFVRGSGCFVDIDGGDEYAEIIVEACDPLPEIARRKCMRCLDIRPGVRQKPFVCGRCVQVRKRAAA